MIYPTLNAKIMKNALATWFGYLSCTDQADQAELPNWHSTFWTTNLILEKCLNPVFFLLGMTDLSIPNPD